MFYQASTACGFPRVTGTKPHGTTVTTQVL